MHGDATLSQERLEALDLLVGRASPGLDAALGLFWWPSEDGRLVILRRGERGFRIPVEALDHPGDEVTLDTFEVGLAPVHRAIDVLLEAVSGEAGPDEAGAAVAAAAAESQALDADFGKDFAVAQRCRDAVQQLVRALEHLGRGERKQVMLAAIEAQSALLP